jgi:hypothetical protein
MTNPRKEALPTKEREVLRACGGVPSFSLESQKAPDSSAPETNTRPSGTEIWRAVLRACQQIPKSLQHAFVVQVLVSILDDQEIPIGSLQEALRKGFESVQRLEEARRHRRAA